MSNFRKVGLTFAVASATAVLVSPIHAVNNDNWFAATNDTNDDAQNPGVEATRSETNVAGDAAIIPYYTTIGTFVTGMHVVNTSATTQAVKVRLRRATDSADALDFNVVMSPSDVWAAAIHADASGNVVVSTSDTTCTVPVSAADANGNKTFNMPDSTNAREGYVEIIGMGSAAQTSAAAANALHVKGTPKDCATLEKNFFRNMNTDTSNGTATTRRYCGDDTSGAGGGYGTCDLDETSDGVTTGTMTTWADTPDEALKVSWFVRDTARALEFGGNAAHISGFAAGPMMTNQQLIVKQDGAKQFDPLNFELPNLDGGPWGATATIADGSAAADSLCETKNNTTITVRGGVGLGALCSDSIITNGTGTWGLYNRLRANNVWGKSSIKNEWAASTSDTRTVTTDWVVTLPGQYLQTDWRPLPPSNASGTIAATNQTASSNDDIPVTYTMTMYDREEASATSTVETCTVGGISVSPAVDDCDTAATPAAKSLSNEVNVITFGGTTHNGGSGAGKGVLSSERLIANWSLDGATEGWANMAMTAATANKSIFYPAPAGQNGVSGTGTDLSERTRPPVLGFAVWERNITADSSMNFGRAISHSYGQSSGGW